MLWQACFWTKAIKNRLLFGTALCIKLASERKEGKLNPLRKRISAIGLMILLLCALWPSVLFAAAEPDCTLTVSKTAAVVGDQVEVEIRVRNAQDWVAYELNLSFDASLWKTGIEDISFMTNLQDGFSSIVNPELFSGGHVRAVFTKKGNAAGESGEVVLGKVRLTAQANGTDTFTLEKIKVGQTGNHWAAYTPNVGTRVQIGGSSDGYTGGGYTETPAAGNEPTITDSMLLVKALPNDAGIVSVKIDLANLQKAIDKLAGTGLNIVLETDAAAKPKQVEVEIPLEQVRNAAGQKIKTVSITSSLAAVALNEKLFAREEAKAAANLQLSVTQMDSSALPAAAKEQVKADTVIYDFQLKLDERPITVLEDKEATVELPYTLRQGEAGHKVVIYRVSANGQPEVVKNARYDQAAGTVQFAPNHSGQYFAAYANKSFQDLHEAEWAREYIEALAARDVVDGMSDGQFDPNGQLTRGQFIAMLVNMFDLTDSTAVSSFTDTARDAWYYPSVATAQKLGIVDGREDGTFGVDERISRQDLAVMLHRASKILGLEGESAAAAAPFADQADIAEYAAEAVAAMQRQGIVNGLEHQIFAPQGLSTRAQAAVVIYRMAFPG
ncbi:hypothetical protein DQG13_04105 [Paenibacillus sp. YN15]|nr:hypothetical protein DQG13_04105 [Paenibacillus sp. YN15]